MTTPGSPHKKQILGYADKLTARPGEHIEFKISVAGGGTYSARLVRLTNGDVYSKGANFRELEIESPLNGSYEGREQPVAPGSCVVVEDVDGLDSLRELTLVVTVMPTTPGQGTQHLISRRDARVETGWSLHINKKGQLAFTVVDRRGMTSSVAIGKPLKARTWYTAALRVSWNTGVIRLDCSAIRAATCDTDIMNESSVSRGLGEYPSASCPLLMAAAFGGRDAGGRVIPTGCFNGRLEAPVMYRRVLSNDELGEVVAGERPSSLSAHLLADWDFSDGMSGTRIKDRSSNEIDAQTHNSPLRAVKGSRWNGRTMEWQHAPDQYAAIHFHSDDLYDCGWLTDIRYQVPDDMRSGIYALRLRRSEEHEAISCEEYVPFFVAAPRGAPSAHVAFIVPTYTYMAYGNVGCIEPGRKASGVSPEEYYAACLFGPGTMQYAMCAAEHRELGLSLYDHHVDGSPVHFSSRLRPLLNLRPKSMLWTFCADLLLIDWLEARDFDYDVITDDLLQEEGIDLLKSYRVVITGNHPEYATTQQLDALESYIGQGGRLMYMGGNGYYWRIAVSGGSIEVRRGRTGTGTWQSDVGESCLALSGEMGGIWRDMGRPPQRLVGVGFIAAGEGICNRRGASRYRIAPEARQSCAAFILEGVEDDIIGDFGIFADGSAGQEIDKTNTRHGTPDNVVVLARSENHGPDMLYVIEEMQSAYPVMEHYHSQTHSEVIFFETRSGGAVFSVGSMTWCGSLSHNGYNNNISTITANVLKRFAKV
jgi:N,N-dimethylformamidase